MSTAPIGDWTGRDTLPGASLPRDIATGEKVEAELDAFVSRRHEARVKAEGERAVEESWRESERRVEAARRAEEGESRLQICRHLASVYARRAEEWARQGDELEGIQVNKGDAA